MPTPSPHPARLSPKFRRLATLILTQTSPLILYYLFLSPIRCASSQFETVNRFKKSLLTRLYPTSEGLKDEGTWPSTTLFRRTQKRDTGLSLETLDGEQEAMYMYALKDGDQIVLLVHETSTSPVIDPVAQWVESIRAQKEFLAVDS